MQHRNFRSWIRSLPMVAVLLLAVAVTGVESVSAQATGRIAGQVTDAATGEPLPGVNVVIEGTTTGASADIDGMYSIGHLPPGEYVIRASMVGFREVVIRDIRVYSNRTAWVNITIEETVIEGEEVIVTAQRPPVDVNVTSSLVHIDARELENRATSSFTDVLRLLPGIDDQDGQMTIRGGTLDEVAIMVDGTRARNPLDHSPYMRFNLGAIQEVEVITGTFNAEHGEARSGVVNVIMKEGGDRYEGYLDLRYTPPGLRHFGTSLYDESSPLYWENTHARHLDWWIEYPDMWVDPNGLRGSDPRSIWTPEEAWQHYMETHQPLTRYWETPTHQTEAGFGGRIPGIRNLHFFATGKYRSEAPVMGNSYRDRGEFYDGTLKLTYRFSPQSRIQFSGFGGREYTSWGIGWLDPWWASVFGNNGRYAFFDLHGLPESYTHGQTLQFTHVLNPRTMLEIRASRVQAYREMRPFPDDPTGWLAEGPNHDHLRARDENGNPIPGGYQNIVGFNTTGYFNQFAGSNNEFHSSGYVSSQMNMIFKTKTGYDFSVYRIEHFNQAKFPNRIDEQIYRPYQGAAYTQGLLELGGLVMNVGLRLDFYNPNDNVFLDIFDPMNGETGPTRTFMQLSPRLGVSHPIDSRTKMHFSYGHFFQRAPFADYGEGNSPGDVRGNLTTYMIEGSDQPWVLGNRELRPTRTIAYEVGVERNFWDAFLLTATGYHKDIRNTIQMITIQAPTGIYQTNGNGDYGANRGFEMGLRKLPRNYAWGSLWGQVNYSARTSKWGRSGAPTVISPTRIRYAPSGEFMTPHRHRIRAGLYYTTPDWNWLGGALGNIVFSFDYTEVRANIDLPADRFELLDGRVRTRPTDRMLNARVRKAFDVRGNRLAPYIEMSNLPNYRWVNLGAFDNVAPEDRERIFESNFTDLPDFDVNGVPILDIARYRNLARSVVFGFQFNF
jgi:outer membrane receptor protein involved in Fe transport